MSTVSDVLNPFIRVYQVALFIAAVVFTLFVPARAPSLIRLDLAMMRIALGISFVLEIAYVAVTLSTMRDLLLQKTVWWFEVVRSLLGTLLIVCVLFLYQVRKLIDYEFMDYQRIDVRI